MDPLFAFAQFKSFGDLTIAAACLRTVATDRHHQISLLIAPHLKTLCEALQPGCSVEVADVKDPDVPALFDIKKRGAAASASSALHLRRAAAKAARGATLVFDRAGLRERFVAGRRKFCALPLRPNVYSAYSAFFEETLPATIPVFRRTSARATRASVAICPVSRVSSKNIKPNVVQRLASQCFDSGFEPVVLRLQGEHLNLPAEIPVRTIPRRFDVLAQALTGFAGVISADSLPAHLAEYVGTPSFVASPIENYYWLPHQAFQNGYSGLFDRPDDMLANLQRFLQSLC